MSKMKWLVLKMVKKNLSNILIFTGIVLTIYASFTLVQWRITQNSNPVLIVEESDLVNIEDGQPAYGFSYEIDRGYQPPETEEEEKEEIYVFETKRIDYEDGMMNITIPKIEVSAEVMGGTSKAQLKKGPGLYDMSPLVYEEEGNVLIAAHRTTYGKWFRHVDKLVEGDPIVLEFEEHNFLYEVERVFIVAHNDWSVTKPQGYSALTLTACHPLYSAKQRIVVRAKLTEINEK